MKVRPRIPVVTIIVIASVFFKDCSKLGAADFQQALHRRSSYSESFPRRWEVPLATTRSDRSGDYSKM
jgi:hypothetical protein